MNLKWRRQIICRVNMHTIKRRVFRRRIHCPFSNNLFRSISNRPLQQILDLRATCNHQRFRNQHQHNKQYHNLRQANRRQSSLNFSNVWWLQLWAIKHHPWAKYVILKPRHLLSRPCKRQRSRVLLCKPPKTMRHHLRFKTSAHECNKK